MSRPWALAGFSGAGKSTLARLVAEAAGRRAVDLDELIGEERVLRLLEAGQEHLRAAEAEALEELAAGPADLVVALGGGVLQGAASRRVLSERFVLAWLDASPATCVARAAAQGRRRPVLEAALRNGPEAVTALHADRTKASRHAMLVVDAEGSATDVARILLEGLRKAESSAEHGG